MLRRVRWDGLFLELILAPKRLAQRRKQFLTALFCGDVEKRTAKARSKNPQYDKIL
jgi:hypothetical protein